MNVVCGVHEPGLPALLLRVGGEGERKTGLAGLARAEDLDDGASRHPADPDGVVDGRDPGRHGPERPGVEDPSRPGRAGNGRAELRQRVVRVLAVHVLGQGALRLDRGATDPARVLFGHVTRR
jgi:hypothetical protein